MGPGPPSRRELAKLEAALVEARRLTADIATTLQRLAEVRLELAAVWEELAEAAEPERAARWRALAVGLRKSGERALTRAEQERRKAGPR